MSMSAQHTHLSGLESVVSNGGSGVISTFIHHVIDDVCGRPQDFFHMYSVEFSPETPLSVIDVVRAYSHLFKTAADSKYNKDQVLDALREVQISPSSKGEVAIAFLSRCSEIRSALAENASTISYQHMDDFDWSLRMIMGSESISTVRQPLIILTLFVSKPGGSRKKIIVELTKEDTDKVLSDFDAINKVVNSSLAVF